MNAMIEKFCELSTYIMVEDKGEKMKRLYDAFHVSDTIVSTFHGFLKIYFSVQISALEVIGNNIVMPI